MEKNNRLISRKPTDPEQEQRMQALEQEFERLTQEDWVAITTEALPVMRDEEFAVVVDDCEK